VEERHKQPGQAVSLAGQPSPSPPLAMYLGYLCPVEEFHVYGYATSTHVKVAYSAKHKRNREHAKSVFFQKKNLKKMPSSTTTTTNTNTTNTTSTTIIHHDRKSCVHIVLLERPLKSGSFFYSRTTVGADNRAGRRANGNGHCAAGAARAAVANAQPLCQRGEVLK
jgi:hypothetical protein